MKQIFRFTRAVFVSALVATLTVSPFAHAQMPETDRLQQFTEQSSKNAEIRSKLCERYTAGRFSSNFDQKEANLRASLSERGGGLIQKRQEADQQRAEVRATDDAKRQEHYAKLLELTTSEVEKEAVAEFQRAVEEAVLIRRSALDAARVAYRAGVDARIAEQRTSFELATADLKLATQRAIEKARTSCEAGAASSEVSATLKAELSQAKEQFKVATKDKRIRPEDLSALKETRDLAYETAKSTFAEALEQARSTLKESLPTDN